MDAHGMHMRVLRCCILPIICIIAAPAVLALTVGAGSLFVAVLGFLVLAAGVVGLVLLLVPPLRQRTHRLARQLVIDLQAGIAKGRKDQQREALDGNYAPVQAEVYTAQCVVVEGALPHELDGVYMRNGSNPYFYPVANYMWFEGDGMVHAVRIRNGAASYCNRWVQTHRLQQEQQEQLPLYAKLGDLRGVRGVSIFLLEGLKYKVGILLGPSYHGTGPANTSLVFHADRLLALYEGDLPYQLRVMCDGVVETVGRLRVGDWSAPFTSHPKLEASTGNLHIIGYNFERQPHLCYGVLEPNGDLKLTQFPIGVPFPSMFHDFAITQNFAVILHMPLVFDPKVIVMHNTLPLVFKPELPSRVGLLPLTAQSGDEIMWYSLPSFYAFHIANAWEDDRGVVQIYVCQLRDVDLTVHKPTAGKGSFMAEITVNPAEGTAGMRTGSPDCSLNVVVVDRWLSQLACEYPGVHPHLQGKQSNYAYLGTMDTQNSCGRINGFAKLDLLTSQTQTECAVATVEFEDQAWGGEPLFVPRSQDIESCRGEDDGYIVVYVTKADGNSYLHIYDALTMSQTPVAEVQLPQRVPLGFHGLWMSAEQIQQQDSSSTRPAGGLTLQTTVKGDVGNAMEDVQHVPDQAS